MDLPPPLSEPAAEAPAPATPRFHGFDALRGGAMLLGIVLHAAVPYMDRPMDGLLWALDGQPSHRGFDLLFWWIHGWRIPLFFVMAGFFAAMLARRRGAGGFLRHRAQRILLPVIAATLTILPAVYFIWGWGWQAEGRATWEEVWRVSFDNPAIDEHFAGPGHLWFLNYLVVFALGYWALLAWRGGGGRHVSPGDDPGPRGRALFHSGWRPLVFAVPTCAALAYDPGYYLAYHHVLPESAQTWAFELLQLIYQAYYFVVGVYLFRLHREMGPLKRWTGAYLAGSALAFGAAMVFARGYFNHLDAGGPWGWAHRLGLAAGVSLFCWLMIWGMIGLGLTVLARPRAWARWLSDSAYWVYLVHLPLVGLGLMALRGWAVSPWAKFGVIVVAVSIAALLSYRYLVRFTFLGWALNGPRSRTPQR